MVQYFCQKSIRLKFQIKKKNKTYNATSPLRLYPSINKFMYLYMDILLYLEIIHVWFAIMYKVYDS